MDNRRKGPRIPLVTMARITPHGLQTTDEALVRDISMGGIGVYVKGHYQKGDALLVKLLFVVNDGAKMMESLKGRIAWVKPLEEAGQFAVGIEIPNMEQRHPNLYAYIKQLEKLNS